MAVYWIVLMCALNHSGFGGSRVAVSIGRLADRVGPRLPMLIGTAGVAFALFPFFKSAYALASIAFLLGLGCGCGCGQPVSMSLIYALSPRERISESTGLRVTVNNFMHLVIPLLFGSIGTAFGYFPVFFSNTAVLVAGGLVMRRHRAPGRGL